MSCQPAPECPPLPPESEGCNLFWNTEQDYTAVCEGGLYGTFTVTIPKKTYMATTQEAADDMAIAAAQEQAEDQLECGYGNEEQTYTAECGSGRVGTPVIVTVTVNTFSAETLGEANALALASATTQALAGLVCLYENLEVIVTATCPTGTTGTEVVVTKAAGLYTGTTQEEADGEAIQAAREEAEAALVCVSDIGTPNTTNAFTYEDVQTTEGLVISRDPEDGSEVAFFKITNIDGGTLYQNDGVTEINDGDFITFAQGAAGLKFTPPANAFAGYSYDIQGSTSADDDGLGGGTVTALITVLPVADTPTVTDATTQMNTQTTDGLVISRNAVDGAEVTHFRITEITGGELFQNTGGTSERKMILLLQRELDDPDEPGDLVNAYPAYVAGKSAYIDTLPFNGLCFHSIGGYGLMDGTVHSTGTLTAEWAPLAAVTWTRMLHNYAIVNVQRPADFFDSWANVITSFANLATVLEAMGNVEGIQIDNEEYTTLLWHYGEIAQTAYQATKTLQEYQVQARLRGSEIMTAMLAVWPTMKVWLLISPAGSHPGTPSLVSEWTPDANNLSGSFFAGFVEEATAAGQVVDGNETSYNYRSTEEFATALEYLKTGFPADEVEFLTEDIRAIYANRINVSTAVYNLPITYANGDLREMDPTILEATLRMAMTSGCETFAWVYWERGTFEGDPIGHNWYLADAIHEDYFNAVQAIFDENLELGSEQINNGDFITYAQGQAGLRFTPDLDSTVDGSFKVQASLSATLPGLGGSLSEATIVVEDDGVTTIMFEDDFNAENGGLQGTNFNGFTQWDTATDVQRRTDLVNVSGVGIGSGNGLFIDMRGTVTGPALDSCYITTQDTFTFYPGSIYRIRFETAGCHRDGWYDQLQVTVGSFYSHTFTIDPLADFYEESVEFEVFSEQTGKLSFVCPYQGGLGGGGPDVGPFVDNVVLERIQ